MKIQYYCDSKPDPPYFYGIFSQKHCNKFSEFQALFLVLNGTAVIEINKYNGEHMSFWYKAPLVIAATCVLIACTSIISIDEETIESPGDLTGSTTFRWDDTALSLMARSEKQTSEYTSTIRDEINRSLASYGFIQVDDEDADMTIGFKVTLLDFETERLVDGIVPYEEYENEGQYGVRWRFGNRQRPASLERTTAEVEIGLYEQGTLHIGAFDRDKRFAWHVSAHKIINERHSRDEHQEVLRKTVRALMARFPINNT